MKFIEKGTANHSFKINIFGIKIRFRNRLAFQNNKILLIDEKGNETRVEKINGLKDKQNDSKQQFLCFSIK